MLELSLRDASALGEHGRGRESEINALSPRSQEIFTVKSLGVCLAGSLHLRVKL